MSKPITRLPASSSMLPEQALEHARAQQASHGMESVLVVGYYADGDFFSYSSRMTRAEALWLLEDARDWARGRADE